MMSFQWIAVYNGNRFSMAVLGDPSSLIMISELPWSAMMMMLWFLARHKGTKRERQESTVSWLTAAAKTRGDRPYPCWQN
jgi:hypothetical protein